MIKTSYIKNFGQSKFVSLFDAFLNVAKSHTPMWRGTVYVGIKPLYLECNVKWIVDKIESYFVRVLPNVHIENAKELYVLEHIAADFIPKCDNQNAYICFIGDNLNQKPDMIINSHCVFMRSMQTNILYLFDNKYNQLYLGENHLLNKLFNYIFDDYNYTVLHGAAVGFNGYGVLITGLSGYGKSTLAAHCLAKGMQFIGDDRIALHKTQNGVFAHPIYATLSLGDNIPKNIKITSKCRCDSNTKDILVLDKSQIHDCIKVCAVIEPVKLNSKMPQIVKTSNATVITKICKDYSVLNTLTASKNPVLDYKKIFNLLFGLEFFNIQLSESISDNVDTIINFLKTGMKNV